MDAARAISFATVRFRGLAASTPGGMTLLGGDVKRLAGMADVAPHLVWALVDVEAAGDGFLPDGRLKTLFEAHIFHRETAGRWTASHPALSSPRWDRSLYWGGPAEYARLERAMALDPGAALRAASWGAGQIMGFNHLLCGYPDARTMVEAFADDVAAQAGAILSYLRAVRALKALREHRFARVARAYNGAGYARHGYHLRLSTAAAARAGLDWLAPGAAGPDVRALQQRLRAAGYEIAADGAFGPKSAGALLAWQAAQDAPHPFWRVETRR